MTGYTLREGLTFCRVDGRFVFLDLPRDRYFCLSPKADEAFLDITAGRSPRSMMPALRDGLLCEAANGARPIACAAPAPRVSMQERSDTVAWTSVLGALSRRSACRIWLRSRSLQLVLDGLKARKSSRAAVVLPAEKVSRVAAAYRRAGMFVSAQDQCLATSLAVAWELAGYGAAPHLVLGVKLRPFQAHCWVQIDDVVVNDQLDTVRLFTPILIV
ncbi:MAG: hypothetical protein CVT77_08680 [Alphaproteobacteria bacterium HGW-Alphaproteobacteria-16]|nr:MAG: hypothetical protein CVT77_08680 [Alphaproteobacteria bacterium HGW-Alphaproteobacteria-16]